MLDADVCDRALAARDARFDGVFFVGIRTTMIYCRPVCPARVSYPDRRRFFETAAAAERDGFRPCLRCRPELAPGRAVVDAVPRVARAAALRIAAGALNGRGVGQLARELGVGERQLRRAMERELGVSPVELAQTHRLLLAKCLLTDTPLPVTRIAFASGFQSLRRFNSVFRERYRMSPSVLRRQPRTAAARDTVSETGADLVRLTLAYRAPLAWEALLQTLARDAMPGVEHVAGRRYARTVSLDGCRGVVLVEDAADSRGRGGRSPHGSHVTVDVSVTLLPVLMPVLARLRHLLDLDAEPAVIDAHLARAGLASLVQTHPGLRIPGAFEGFEAAVRELVRTATRSTEAGDALESILVLALGEPVDTGLSGLTRLAPTAARIAAAGPKGLAQLGIPKRQSVALAAVAGAVTERAVRLEPGADVDATLGVLRERCGLGDRTAAAIVRRALHWPDAFPRADTLLQRAAGARSGEALLRMAERWRPWRAYAALHLAWRERLDSRKAS
jgi:AraC family transcriptional regulator of adaptative response / DNA-3-methyladenine glycosylase II